MKAVLFLVRPILGLALLSATPLAEAETRPACAERDLVIERLENRYGETRQSMGLHQNNGVLEVYASPETGSWTILVTMPNGMSCLIAAGQLWEQDATPLAKTGSGA